MAPVPLRQSLLRKLLAPSARTLLAAGMLALAGAVYSGWTFLPFLTGGRSGEAVIDTVETPSPDYARYTVRLLGRQDAYGMIDSDRRSLAPGDILPVLYLEKHPSRILSIELFVPWTRAIWLALFGFAALALGLRERALAKAGTGA